MVAMIKHRTRLPEEVIKTLILENFKTGYQQLWNGIGKARHMKSCAESRGSPETPCRHFSTTLVAQEVCSCDKKPSALGWAFVCNAVQQHSSTSKWREEKEPWIRRRLCLFPVSKNSTSALLIGYEQMHFSCTLGFQHGLSGSVLER